MKFFFLAKISVTINDQHKVILTCMLVLKTHLTPCLSSCYDSYI